jgi:hypothetical protein
MRLIESIAGLGAAQYQDKAIELPVEIGPKR